MKMIHVLLVEDNEGDILLTTEALEEGQIAKKISVVKDGKEAFDFLDRKGKYSNADRPNLILLDINLPKKNGHEVLRYIKGNEKLRNIPVIILTTSSSDKDMELSNKHHANSYITKPVEAAYLRDIVANIEKDKQ